MRPKGIKAKIKNAAPAATQLTDVPCTTIPRLLERGGQPNGVSMFWLDVEGAEAKVLQTMNLTQIGLFLIENADDRRHKSDVEPQLFSAGFHRVTALESSSWNPVYVRRGGPMTHRCIACADDPECREKYW